MAAPAPSPLDYLTLLNVTGLNSPPPVPGWTLLLHGANTTNGLQASVRQQSDEPNRHSLSRARKRSSGRRGSFTQRGHDIRRYDNGWRC
jgi:hypothetical protein